MKLTDFLKQVGWKESDIIEYKWKIALEAVRQNWYALQYVKDQTLEIVLEAVKQNWDALRYVDKSIFEQDIPEYTIEELQEKLWEEFKIIR